MKQSVTLVIALGICGSLFAHMFLNIGREINRQRMMNPFRYTEIPSIVSHRFYDLKILYICVVNDSDELIKDLRLERVFQANKRPEFMVSSKYVANRVQANVVESWKMGKVDSVFRYRISCPELPAHNRIWMRFQNEWQLDKLNSTSDSLIQPEGELITTDNEGRKIRSEVVATFYESPEGARPESDYSMTIEWTDWILAIIFPGSLVIWRLVVLRRRRAKT